MPLARKRIWLVAAVIALTPVLLRGQGGPVPPRFDLLVFSKTAAFRHGPQIAAGISALQLLAVENDFSVEFSEDGTDFTPENLERFDVVLFLDTSGDVLDPVQQAAFEAWLAEGNGWAGVHSAADTEYGWPFYGGLVGAYFDGHPQPQTATVHVADATHPSTEHLPAQLDHFDEWYNFATNPADDESFGVLLNLDESTYIGGTMGDPHPIAWYRAYQGGRTWYTAMGHTLTTEEDYTESFFREHLLGGLEYAALPEPAAPGLAAAAVATLGLLASRRRRSP